MSTVILPGPCPSASAMRFPHQAQCSACAVPAKPHVFHAPALEQPPQDPCAIGLLPHRYQQLCGCGTGLPLHHPPCHQAACQAACLSSTNGNCASIAACAVVCVNDSVPQNARSQKTRKSSRRDSPALIDQTIDAFVFDVEGVHQYFYLTQAFISCSANYIRS